MGTLDDTTDPQLGLYAGPYRLLERIGEGGMGVVHRAIDLRGAPVAVKVLRPHIAVDTIGRERLAREVRTMQRVRGPHVAEVLDADTEGRAPFVVTRYVEGRPLSDVVAQNGPLALRPLLMLALGLADALVSIHEAGVIHRDLKPSNVLMHDTWPVVIDFGIAQAIDDTRLTSTGLFIGTPGYLAPETVRTGDATPASDVATWAATVAYAATGRAPFGTGPLEVVLGNVVTGRLDLRGVPEALAAVLRDASADDPARRPSASALRGRLAGLLASRDTFELPAQPRAARTRTLPPAQDAAPGTATGDPWLYRPAQRIAPLAAPLAPPASRPAAPARRPAPRGRGRLITLALSTAAAGLMAAVPFAGALALGSALVVLNTGDAMAATVERRRAIRGRRRTDHLVAAISSPWRLVTSLLASAVSLLLAGALGAVMGLPGALLTPDHPQEGAVAVAAVLVSMFVWAGPGSAGSRSGARRFAGTIGRRGTVILAFLFVAVAAGAVAVALADPVNWWPTGGALLRDSLPTGLDDALRRLARI